MNITINDLPIAPPFRVFDTTTGHFIHSMLDPNEPGDIAPDIAVLPVTWIHAVNGVLYIDVKS